ncbi:MAG: NADH-quinone oxidoreductase subunit A [Pirellulales bacterium]
MSSAMDVSVGLVAYLALFAGVGLTFLFVNLLVGRLFRADNPHPEKLEIYECGEPTIGSSFVQFDLRFYVVALLFIIFDVEVAFFFPWATVYGKANHLADPGFAAVTATADGQPSLTRAGRDLYRELGVVDPSATAAVPPSLSGRVATGLDDVSRAREIARAGARQLAGFTLIDIAVFFGILLVGFAYVWRRGDLDWVRAVGQQRAAERGQRGARGSRAESPVLSA